MSEVQPAWSQAATVRALAFDYDGTLATEGEVSATTFAALQRARQSGRALLMVTGRELPQLKEVFPHLALFELVVAENGALLYRPETDEARALAQPAPPAFARALRRRGVSPSVGEVIVATVEHEAEVREAMAEVGLDWRIIRNKESVMCLPAGVDKASGLRFALAQLEIAPSETMGVGDAENDLPFLALCGVAAAVANALPTVKAAAAIVARHSAGDGVVELIDTLLATPTDTSKALVS